MQWVSCTFHIEERSEGNELTDIRALVAFLIVIPFLSVGPLVTGAGYYLGLAPDFWGATEITWTVTDCPSAPFGLFWSGESQWIAQLGSKMVFSVLALGEDVRGQVSLGNATWTSNDTEIAKDLTLGVWGITPWLPGFIVAVGNDNLRLLNETAYASAERVFGNYVNGSILSQYESVVAGGLAYDCLTFQYQQDNTTFGEPQRTYLAYDTVTGVLVKGNTSLSFGTPYSLAVELTSVQSPKTLSAFIGALGVVSIAVALVIVLLRRAAK